MESQIAKRRRLYAGSHVPARVLSKLLKRIRQEENVDEALNVSEWKLKQAVATLWDEVGQVETLHYSKDGGDFVWHCASLVKLLQHAIATSPAFKQAIRSMWELGHGTLPASPAHLVVYCD